LTSSVRVPATKRVPASDATLRDEGNVDTMPVAKVAARNVRRESVLAAVPSGIAR
jgi:hypothetical protein